jgi:hypothetical protein
MGAGIISRISVTTVLKRGPLLSSWLNTTGISDMNSKSIHGNCEVGRERGSAQVGYEDFDCIHGNHNDNHNEKIEYLQIATESNRILLKTTPLLTSYATRHTDNKKKIKNKKNKNKNKPKSSPHSEVDTISWITQIIPRTLCNILNPNEMNDSRKSRNFLPINMLFNNSQKYIYENSILTDDNFSLFECQKTLLRSLLNSDVHHVSMTAMKNDAGIPNKDTYSELYQIIDSLQSLLLLRLNAEAHEQLRALNAKWMMAFPKVQYTHTYVFIYTYTYIYV